MKIEYAPGLKNHSLLLLKEIFLSNIYSFTNATDQKLKSLQEKGEEGVILDIGANIGIATAYFKCKYPNISLIAIEASPVNYEQLVKNIKNNNLNNITTYNAFVSSKSEQVHFYHNNKKPGSSFGQGFKLKNSPHLVEFVIDTIRINDVIKDLKNIVIKIDVEGAEYEILNDLSKSNNFAQVIEITTEISIQNRSQFDSLHMILNKYYDLGFEPRFISDYGISNLKNESNQGHLQLILFKS
jgi:FkbM family methyltransferase